MMEAWRSLLYADEDQKAKDLRDPVAPAKRSDSAMKKIRTKRDSMMAQAFTPSSDGRDT